MVTIIKHDFLYPSHILKLLCYIIYLECTETQTQTETETHDIRWEGFFFFKLLSQKRKEKKRKGKEKIQMYKHWARPVDIAVNFNSQQESLLLYWLISVSSIYRVFDLISSCNFI